MNELWKEPGVWALAALLVFAAINLVVALILRKSRRRMLHLISEIVAENRLAPGDKAWLRDEIDNSKGAHMLFAAPFAPFAILAAAVMGVYEGWSGRTIKESTIAAELEIEEMHIERVQLAQGVDPRSGNYWNDARRREICVLGDHLENWNNPIAMIWIMLWMGVAAPGLFIGYWITGSIRPFVVNVWTPLREPVVSTLPRAALRH